MDRAAYRAILVAVRTKHNNNKYQGTIIPPFNGDNLNNQQIQSMNPIYLAKLILETSRLDERKKE